MNVDTHLVLALEVTLQIMLRTGQGVACQAHSQARPWGMAGMHCVGLHTVTTLMRHTGKLAPSGSQLAPACVALAS